MFIQQECDKRHDESFDQVEWCNSNDNESCNIVNMAVDLITHINDHVHWHSKSYGVGGQ